MLWSAQVLLRTNLRYTNKDCIYLDLQDLPTSHHAYTSQTAHLHHTPQLQLDIIASMQPDLEQPHTSAAPSASTDYSQQSFLDRPHTQVTMGTYVHGNNDFDFIGGHITISGAIDSAISLSAHESLANQNAIASLHTLPELDLDGYSLGLACADGNELVGCENDLQDPAHMTCSPQSPIGTTQLDFKLGECGGAVPKLHDARPPSNDTRPRSVAGLCWSESGVDAGRGVDRSWPA